MRVRQAFLDQAGYCDRLGSPFTALLCRALAEGLEGSSDIERDILAWPGDPGPFADSVPLRLAGALHALVRAGRAPELAELYPPQPMPSSASLLTAVRAVLRDQDAFIRDFLRSPPQTNEVGRSAAIMAGWLEIAARARLPLALYEIGSSAGLNLIADRYSYRFGEAQWTPGTGSRGAAHQDAGLVLSCGWKGRSPSIRTPLRVRSRRGCDRSPIRLADPAQRERLVAYVWPDQRERLERLNAAIRAMLAAPVDIEAADAADWIESVLRSSGEPGIVRVIFHSIVWSYLDRTAQERIASHLAKVGTASSADSPLAWLRLELAGQDEPAALRLTMWPGGDDELLARAHPHGAWVRWHD